MILYGSMARQIRCAPIYANLARHPKFRPTETFWLRKDDDTALLVGLNWLKSVVIVFL
jgi:hypothetical protein